MNIVNQKKRVELSSLVYFLGFMKKVCWEKKENWVPFVKDKPKSRTRIAMDKAATYIATAESGRSLNPARFEQSIRAIQNWKFYFVQQMAEKVNIQQEEACKKRISLAESLGKKVSCPHKDNHLLGKEGASILADNLFRMYYDAEVRAMEENPVDPYFTRDPGPIEFGRSMADAEFLPRQFAEQPTGEFYLQSEDEHSISWKLVDGDFFSDDEVVEDEEGFTQLIDWNERNERYFDLRQLLLHRKFSGEVILRKAHAMATADMISFWQFKKLREFAVAIANFRNRPVALEHCATSDEQGVCETEYNFVTIR